MTTDEPNDRAESRAPLAGGDVLVPVHDFAFPNGWSNPALSSLCARRYCELLERGKILYFESIPYDFPQQDRQFLLSQRQSDSPLHKNISYRPRQDVLRGASGPGLDVEQLRQVMRRYSAEVTRFLAKLLEPYAAQWSLDYASYRPEEEQGRNLPVHKRNDLLHVDSFPTRPMHGNRILRCFTNINPNRPRIWNTTSDGFPALAEAFAAQAGLARIAAQGSRLANPLVRNLKKIFGFKAVGHSAYDRFMLAFHDFLKEKTDFQQGCPKIRLQFPPGSTWICFTDSVPHAVLSGQYALEQTFIIALPSLLLPGQAPIRVLERMAGKPLIKQGTRPRAVLDAPGNRNS